MPTMPNGLYPVSNPGGYSHGDPGGVSRTATEGGFPRYAQSFQRGPQQFSVTIPATETEYEIWVLFFTHVLKNGTLTFDMPLQSGFGLQQHSGNIIPGSHRVTETDGHNYIINFQFEAESKAFEFEAGAAELIIDYHNSSEDLVALLDRIAIFANEDVLVLP